MKKRMMAVVLAAVFFAGAAGGARADRLNLWPILSVDDGVDVLWPIAHFKSAEEWRVFPVFRGHKFFAVFPELWFWDDGFAILPLGASYDGKSGTLFPLAWWDFDDFGSMHTLFPLYYWNNQDDGRQRTFWAGCGLGGYRRDGGRTAHWLLPFYAKGRYGDFFSIPYTRLGDGDGGRDELYLFGLAGRGVDAGGETAEHWCFPLWYKSPEKLLTLPLCLGRDEEGALESWLSLPLLSWGGRKGDAWSERYLLGLGGRSEDGATGLRRSWLAPFYYAASDGTFITPLYGHTKQSRWCFPLWYDDECSFYSAFWCQRRNEAGEIDLAWAPLLLSGFGVEGDGTREFDALLGLAGARWGGATNRLQHWFFPLYAYEEGQFFSTLPFSFSRQEDGGREVQLMLGLAGASWGGARRRSWLALVYYEDSEGTFITPIAGKAGASHWAVPLYYANRETGTLLTLPYGHVASGGRTNTWWATPLVGTHSGTATGGWFFPFFHRAKDADFDRDAAWLDGDALPGEIRFRSETKSWTNHAGEVQTWTNVIASVDVQSAIHGSFLLLSDHDRSIRGSVGRDGPYRLQAHSKQGNRLVFNRETMRTVEFDTETRRKTAEHLWSQTTALCGLFQHTHRENCGSGGKGGPADGGTHTRTRLLWKLWDRQEDNGDVRIDAFPGFTHDSRTNGYTKTSFLWRFFRHEHDPETGKTAVDVLFVPVWR